MSGRGPAMGWTEWLRHDATALAALVRSGQLTASEVVAQSAAGLARVDDRLEGVLELFHDVVVDPHRDRPDCDGVLYGVPVFLKDLGSRLAGRLQESGSRLLKGNLAKETDPLVANFLRAGLIPLGRSTCPEFGMTFDTATAYLGRVKVSRNPWNPERTPGGSSGGSAALVAAGVTPISMASDGGGSTRIPASYCGLVGLKASRGRVAPPLAHSEYTWRIAVEGVVTRSVRDSAAALDQLWRKPPGGTFYPMAPPDGSYVEALARALEGLGHDVEQIDDRRLLDWGAMWRGYLTQWIAGRTLYAPIAELGGTPAESLQSVLSPMVWRHFEAAQRYSTLDLPQAMACNNVVTRGFGRFMGGGTRCSARPTRSVCRRQTGPTACSTTSRSRLGSTASPTPAATPCPATSAARRGSRFPRASTPTACRWARCSTATTAARTFCSTSRRSSRAPSRNGSARSRRSTSTREALRPCGRAPGGRSRRPARLEGFVGDHLDLDPGPEHELVAQDRASRPEADGGEQGTPAKAGARSCRRHADRKGARYVWAQLLAHVRGVCAPAQPVRRAGETLTYAREACRPVLEQHPFIIPALFLPPQSPHSNAACPCTAWSACPAVLTPLLL